MLLLLLLFLCHLCCCDIANGRWSNASTRARSVWQTPTLRRVGARSVGRNTQLTGDDVRRWGWSRWRWQSWRSDCNDQILTIRLYATDGNGKQVYDSFSLPSACLCHFRWQWWPCCSWWWWSSGNWYYCQSVTHLRWSETSTDWTSAGTILVWSLVLGEGASNLRAPSCQSVELDFNSTFLQVLDQIERQRSEIETSKTFQKNYPQFCAKNVSYFDDASLHSGNVQAAQGAGRPPPSILSQNFRGLSLFIGSSMSPFFLVYFE